MAEKAKASYAKWGKFDPSKPQSLSVAFTDEKEARTFAVLPEPFLAHYGLKQWLADKAAKASSAAEYRAIAMDYYSRAQCGQFADLGYRLDVLRLAVGELRGKTPEEVAAAFKPLDEKQIEGIYQNKEVREIYDRLVLEERRKNMAEPSKEQADVLNGLFAPKGKK